MIDTWREELKSYPEFWSWEKNLKKYNKFSIDITDEQPIISSSMPSYIP